MSPAGIGIKEADGTIRFVVIADLGWIKDEIGDVLNRKFTTKEEAQMLILKMTIPEGFLPLRGTWPSEACNEANFLRKLVCHPRCVISYAYLWKDGGWTFRRIDGSDSISLEEAIRQGIEDRQTILIYLKITQNGCFYEKNTQSSRIFLKNSFCDDRRA